MKDGRPHSLLARQLKKVGATLDAPPSAEGWAKLLELVDDAYVAADDERERLERSVMLSEDDMQRALRDALEERERFRAVFESAALGIVLTHPDGTVAEANPCFAKLASVPVEELLGRPLAMLGEVLATTPIRSASHPGLFEYKVRPTNGAAEVDVEVAASVIHDAEGAIKYQLLLIDDVTERRRMAFELKQAQKLETVGRLASGIAHEINTPIQFVGDSIAFIGDAVADLGKVFVKYAEAHALGFPQALMREVDAAAAEVDMPFLMTELPGAVARSHEGLQRVATIVRAMKEFAHPDQTEQAPVDLASNIKSTIAISRNEYKYVADVVQDYGEVPPITAFANDLNQVFLNLFINAAHAIEDCVRDTRRRGVIGVRTSLAGDHVRIEISDTGSGIPENVRERIFDPFFTTKDVGQGTGLGLSIVYKIVQQHGGRISVDSKVGQGTKFTVVLPIEAAPAMAA